jgi:hypothetical protein
MDRASHMEADTGEHITELGDHSGPEVQNGHSNEDPVTTRNILGKSGALVLNAGTVFIDTIQLGLGRLGRLPGAVINRARFGSTGAQRPAIIRPVITAEEAERKIEEYTIGLVNILTRCNERYAAARAGEYPSLDASILQLIRLDVGRTVDDCFTIVPSEDHRQAVQERRAAR